MLAHVDSMCVACEGVLIGSPGIELGQLRFYPKVLKPSDIEEIYEFGSQMSDMATGSEPTDAAETGLLAIQRSVTGEVKKVNSLVGARQSDVQVDLIAQAVDSENALATISYASPPMPLGDTDSESWDVVTRMHMELDDPVTGRKYLQIASGPHRLTETSDADSRYLSNVPNFDGTGATLTFWCVSHACIVPLAS